MRRISIQFTIMIMLASAVPGPVLACRGCTPEYRGLAGEYRHAKRADRFGYHEYFGFYDSCYRANADGGFHSAIGRDCTPHLAKRRVRTK